MSFHVIQKPPSGEARGALGAAAGFGVLAAVLLGATGCTATVTPAPVAVTYDAPVVEANAVPVDVYTYPRVYYGGTTVYLVNGRWYYPSGRTWRVYRSEPRELARHRTQIESSPTYRVRPEYAAPREIRRERR